MNPDFEPPPRGRVAFTIVSGIATAIALIFGIETLATKFPNPNTSNKNATESLNSQQSEMLNSQAKRLAKLDAQAVQWEGTPVPLAQQLPIKLTAVPVAARPLTATEQAIARHAWEYFRHNWNETTGLVNSVNDFASVTLWDQAAALAALVSAKELRIIPTAEFEQKLDRMLTTLAKLPLYRKELPNKVYNAKTLIPVNYGKLDKPEEIGWSAIDLGRMVIWLQIVGSRYPKFQPQVTAIRNSWNVQRLTQQGQMFGTSVINGKEQYHQEGRLGYENYAAFGLKLWGLNVEKALETRSNTAFVNLYNQGVPYDKRDHATSGANNYVLSEPYILDGIETGFQSLPKAYADRILAAQESRYQATNQLTAVTEDNLDRAPYFVYNTLFVNGQPWGTITDTRTSRPDLRFLSAKAAIGWHVLYNTPYTEKLSQFVQTQLKADKGWYNGFYESLNSPNKALTANNNGVILESLLYQQVGQPLIQWAQVNVPRSEESLPTGPSTIAP
ncbi:DUF3131 domain-containing protein [Alkalinema pantanalense CENA528]|uniref:DUF3131 domain-containing protein n=1 Tax=Alkalinema pantanalense TaxID=1620705 RepID=UPI003D6F3827